MLFAFLHDTSVRPLQADFWASDLLEADGAGEEEATQAIAVLFVFIFNPNYCVGDGTEIYLGKQNHLESLVRVLNGVERAKKMGLLINRKGVTLA